MKTISTTYCRHFDNFCYHHQCIANWTAVILLQVLMASQEKTLWKMKNAKDCFGSDVWCEAYVVTWLSWMRADGCLHSALVCALESMKIHESAAAVNCCHCQWPQGCESQPDDMGWLASVCRVQTDELSDVRCFSIRFVKLRCVCSM